MPITPAPILPKSLYRQLNNGVELHYFCWNQADTEKPVALLQHGTGFVAACFDELAQHLREHFRVYAYDRRGHGLSSKPEQGYTLADFADDSLQFCEAMGWQDIYGIGHSAGATDLIIGESLQPGLFRKLFVMEPTITDPESQSISLAEAKGGLKSRIDQALKRRAEFPSRQAVWESYRDKPLFASWQETALSAYIYYGFAEQDDGSVRLQCKPAIEAEVLKDIFQTFANAKDENDKDPFAQLGNVHCEMAISQSELSGPQFKDLSRRARAHFPWAKSIYFEGLGHCVPQEDSAALAKEVLAFLSPLQ